MDLLPQAAAGFQGIDADPALKEQALKFLGAWLGDVEFAPYRPQLDWLIQTKQWAALLDRFYQIIPFGTGGRRGAVGIGPNRFNLWSLGASVQGHCVYLRQRFPEVALLRVVLAYDVRRFEDQRKNYNPELPNPVLHLSSKDFAQYAARIYTTNGVEAFILPAGSPRYLATPELSYTIRYLKAHGGLNISASHNPPDDNGGKFYDERGGQPVPPEDQAMADLVDQVRDIRIQTWAEATSPPSQGEPGGVKVRWLDEAPHVAYIDLCRQQTLVPPPRADEFAVVFTPLHGVGSMTAMKVLTQHGFRVIPVAEQMTPDGMFPNVTPTPNPELPQSLAQAARLAEATQADLVLATDPDADRLGVIVRSEAGAARPYRYLTGNETGALLTHFKLSKLREQGRLPRTPIVIKTEVTSALITRIARHFGAQVVDDLLVGFKYIADVLWHLEKTGAYQDVRGRPEDFVIACEESIGFLTTPEIRDKDAAAPALLMAELALDQKRQGRTAGDYLSALYREFGCYRTELVPVVMTGLEGKQNMTRMLDGLRSTPLQEIGGLAVTAFEDLRDERGRLGPFKGATDRAARNFLIYRLGERAKIALRPSGTEPKAKAYIEVCSGPLPAGAAVAEAEQELEQLIKRLMGDFLHRALGIVGLKPPADP